MTSCRSRRNRVVVLFGIFSAGLLILFINTISLWLGIWKNGSSVLDRRVEHQSLFPFTSSYPVRKKASPANGTTQDDKDLLNSVDAWDLRPALFRIPTICPLHVDSVLPEALQLALQTLHEYQQSSEKAVTIYSLPSPKYVGLGAQARNGWTRALLTAVAWNRTTSFESDWYDASFEPVGSVIAEKNATTLVVPDPDYYKYYQGPRKRDHQEFGDYVLRIPLLLSGPSSISPLVQDRLVSIARRLLISQKQEDSHKDRLIGLLSAPQPWKASEIGTGIWHQAALLYVLRPRPSVRSQLNLIQYRLQLQPRAINTSLLVRASDKCLTESTCGNLTMSGYIQLTGLSSSSDSNVLLTTEDQNLVRQATELNQTFHFWVNPHEEYLKTEDSVVAALSTWQTQWRYSANRMWANRCSNFHLVVADLLHVCGLSGNTEILWFNDQPAHEPTNRLCCSWELLCLKERERAIRKWEQKQST